MTVCTETFPSCADTAIVVNNLYSYQDLHARAFRHLFTPAALTAQPEPLGHKILEEEVRGYLNDVHKASNCLHLKIRQVRNYTLVNGYQLP